MKNILLPLLFASISYTIHAQSIYPNVVIETTQGKMVVVLHDNTPFHCENFINLVNDGCFISLINFLPKKIYVNPVENDQGQDA